MVWLLCSHSPNAGAAETWQMRGVLAGNPTRITSAKIGLNLPVQRGHYNKDTEKWQIDEKGAFFSGTSANNVGGQTVVYAHNWPGLFADIPKLERGDNVTLQSDTGHTFTYQLSSRFETIPRDGSIYSYTGAPRLVLITCAGKNDTKRLIQIFTLEKIDSPNTK